MGNYLVDAILAATKNKVIRDGSLPTAKHYQAIWNGAEASDSNLSNITLQGGGTARYVPKAAHVTGLVAGDIVLVTSGGSSPFFISAKLVGDIRLAQYSADTIPPSGVGAVTSGTITSSSIVLNWTTATDNIGVAGYQLTINGSFAGLVNTNTYTAGGLTASTSYTFTVRAVDYAGNLGSISSNTFATTAGGGGGSGTLVLPGKWSATYQFNLSTGATPTRLTSYGGSMAEGTKSGLEKMGAVQFSAVSPLLGKAVTSCTLSLTPAHWNTSGVHSVVVGTVGVASVTSAPSTLAPTSSGFSEEAYGPLSAPSPGTSIVIPIALIDAQSLQVGLTNTLYVGSTTATGSAYDGYFYGTGGGVYAPKLTFNYV